MQVCGFGGLFVCSSPFPSLLYHFFFQRINCEAQGCSVFLGLPRTQICLLARPVFGGLLSDLFVPPDAVCVDGCGSSSRRGVVPAFWRRPYADIKEWWSKALKSRQRSQLPSVLGATGLWVLGLGLAKSSISSSSRTSRPLNLLQ
ncbi:hypothetical protein GWK47_025383 [Chionoecetes opilio]|uniref:Uncharacterized protein n=1 Tax=Chionoecetes opilio TaxID=41210 RepID=A0A8J8WG39_CHIOP|nr:hypothetical protein GWK47_025383 [Chionoecetes opilio]